MTAKEWIEAFSSVVGTTAPDDETQTVLLDLAGEAAHSSERIAAPIACYIAGKMGIAPREALELARRVADREG